MSRSSAWTCVDCDRSTRKLLEYYMVVDSVWAQVGSPNMLCIGCLERRLGRPLTQSDMLSAPVNWTPHMPRSEQLTRILGNMIMTPEQWAARPPQLRAHRQKGFGRLDLHHKES